MTPRSLTLPLLVGALLLPMALTPAASSVETAALAPDLAVTQLRIQHVPDGIVVPPWSYIAHTTVCNFGTATVPGGVAFLRWTVQAQPGPLRVGSSGPVREFNVLLHEHPLGPQDCEVTSTFWGQPWSLGEYEFTARVTVKGDTNPTNDLLRTRAAFPSQLQGSNLGGVDAIPER